MLPRKWVLICAALGWIALAFFTTGCGSSSSNAKIRLVNAMPDEGGLDLLIDTKSVSTGVGYGAASSYVGIASGSRQIQVEPTGNTNVLFTRTDSIGSGNTFTLVSLNFSSNPSNVLLPDDNSTPTSGNFKLRIVNASSGMGTQDVYIVTDGTDIGSVSPTISSLAFQNASGYSTLVAGDYRVFFTPPGQKFINLDSGKLTFASGQVRTVLGLNNTVGGFESTLLTDAN